jgi:hypothetical protein
LATKGINWSTLYRCCFASFSQEQISISWGFYCGFNWILICYVNIHRTKIDALLCHPIAGLKEANTNWKNFSQLSKKMFRKFFLRDTTMLNSVTKQRKSLTNWKSLLENLICGSPVCRQTKEQRQLVCGARCLLRSNTEQHCLTCALLLSTRQTSWYALGG